MVGAKAGIVSASLHNSLQSTARNVRLVKPKPVPVSLGNGFIPTQVLSSSRSKKLNFAGLTMHIDVYRPLLMLLFCLCSLASLAGNGYAQKSAATRIEPEVGSPAPTAPFEREINITLRPCQGQ